MRCRTALLVRLRFCSPSFWVVGYPPFAPIACRLMRLVASPRPSPRAGRGRRRRAGPGPSAPALLPDQTAKRPDVARSMALDSGLCGASMRLSGELSRNGPRWGSRRQPREMTAVPRNYSHSGSFLREPPGLSTGKTCSPYRGRTCLSGVRPSCGRGQWKSENSRVVRER
jgi:hypothetical protein